MRRKGILILMMLLCMGGILFSGYRMYGILTEYRTGTDTYDEMEQYALIDGTPADGETSAPAETESMPEETSPATATFPTVDFEALWKVNPDVAAWIYIPDTQIHYPIVQGKNNKVYLKKMIDGTRNAAGSIFMDYRNDRGFTDVHTMVYGHHMKNGSMFAGLTKYKSQDYYQAHPTILLVTPEEQIYYDIVAAYVAKPSGKTWTLTFADQTELEDWLAFTQTKSAITTSVTPDVDDQFLSLATCSYEFDDARFVVVAVRR